MSGFISGLVWKHNLEKSDQVVLLAMADHADQEGENVFPSIALIAWKTGLSERHVHRVITSLKIKGFLEAMETNLHKPVLYRILFPESARKTAYESPHLYAKKITKIGVTSSVIPSPENRYDISPPLGMTQLCQTRYDTAMSYKPSVNRTEEPSVQKPQTPSGGAPPSESRVEDEKKTNPRKPKRDVKTRPTSGPTPSGLFACALIAAFHDAFKANFGVAYHMPAAEARHARELHGTGKTVEEIMAVCKSAWTRQDQFVCKNLRSITHLSRDFSAIEVALGTPKTQGYHESPASKQRRISEQMKLAQEDYDDLRSKWDYHVTLTPEELLRFNSLKSKLKELRSELTGIK